MLAGLTKMPFKRYIERDNPGTILERIRVQSFKMSQKNFAQIIGKSQSTIGRWELPADHLDKSYPKASDIGKIRVYAKENDLRIPDRVLFDLIDECER